MSTAMTRLEVKASLSLAGLHALRMLGMFLLLPVFALYAVQLPGANQTLVGWAMGAYGISQALLQLPFGMLSDKYGRKRIIYIGLAILIAGSALAAVADNIYLLIFARFLQGGGAISAAITALLADLTREEHRTKAMAMVGTAIGTTFTVSLILGPALNGWIGVPGIFALTGVLACAAMLGVWKVIPNPSRSRFHSDAEVSQNRLPRVLKMPELLRLNLGVFCLHATMMAMFVVMPFELQAAGIAAHDHWHVYLPVVLGGMVLMVPGIIYGEKRGKMKNVFVAAVALMFATQFALSLSTGHFGLMVACLASYFTAFNILEASLPSLVSKLAPVEAKGTAIGVYNGCQSLGLAVGAPLGGWVGQHYGHASVFLFCFVLVGLWLLAAATMRPLPKIKTMMYHIADDWAGDAQQLSQQLARLPGVLEVVVIKEESVAYLKVSPDAWNQADVEQLIEGTNHGIA